MRVGDRARLPLRTERACQSCLGKFCREQPRELILHAPEMLEYLRHRPAVGGGTGFAKRRGNGVHCLVKGGAVHLEVVQ